MCLRTYYCGTLNGYHYIAIEKDAIVCSKYNFVKINCSNLEISPIFPFSSSPDKWVKY